MLFSNTFNHDYAWDDRIVITENPYVLSGLSGLEKIWIKQHSDFLHDKVGYRPITLTSFAIEQEFAPSDPRLGHLVNVLLYAFSVISIIYFLRLAMGIENWLMVFLIALLFAVHPLHVEVVANIKSRDEILQFLFGMWSVIAFRKWMGKGAFFYLVLTIVLLLSSILSKENGITMVGVMGLVLITGRTSFTVNRKMIVQLAGLVGLGFLSIATISFGLSGDSGKELTDGLGVFYESPILGDCFRQTNDAAVLLINKNLLIHRYIWKFLYPVNLTYYTGFNQIPMYETFSIGSLGGIVGTISLIAVVVYSFKSAPLIFRGLMLFLILISPYLHLLRPMPDTMADRYAFGASLGLSVVTVVGLKYLVQNVRKSQQYQNTILAFLVCSLVLVFSFLTHSRNEVWANNLSLFEADLEKLDSCAKAHEFYADALYAKLESDRAEYPKLVPLIVKHYERSIEISELSYYSFIKLGSNYRYWGNPQRGLEVLKRSVELFPEQADPHFYYGNALYESTMFENAIPHFQKAKELSPNVYDSYFLEARSYLELAYTDKAITVAKQALSTFPNQVLLRDVISDALLMNGDTTSAIAQLDTIISVQPTVSQFWKKTIGLRQLQGKQAQADSVYQRALSIGVDFGR